MHYFVELLQKMHKTKPINFTACHFSLVSQNNKFKSVNSGKDFDAENE